ncbi:hypothetical protein HOLleu_08464 [Holothuria leucospilota]|uniref:Uncharacterized protein n=1 Tax=Holothuria leucospilota TaxID=206669 RepID=A0A9Q1HHT8_HOLLE|nr:hypothetical protein HOLleu_08464 [Holothuria leucospilota]
MGEVKGKRSFVITDGRNPTKRDLSQRWLHDIGTGHTVDNLTFRRHKVMCFDHFPGTALRRKT